MKTGLLRNLMLLDAVVLLLLGGCLVLAPQMMRNIFDFRSLPVAVNYLLGLWGCVFISLAVGCFLAAANPAKNIVWVQVGIARGVLETMLGLYYIAQGLVTWGQAWFGIAAAIFFAVAYLALYPRGVERTA